MKKNFVSTILLNAILLLCTATFAWNSLFGANALAANQDVIEASTSVINNYPLSIGDYLSTEFIEQLRQTRSGLKARVQSDYRQYVIVKAVDNKLTFTLMADFHSGLAGFGVNAAGQITGSYQERFRDFNVPKKNEFMITHEGKKLTYRYVGNLQKFLIRNTIAGKYKDSQGRIYSFTEDGQAQFPERHFRFIFVEDYPGDAVDAIAEMPPGGRESIQDYGFKFVGDELQLFEMGGPMGDVPEPNPFAKLTPINETESKP